MCDVAPIICLSLFTSLQPFYTRWAAMATGGKEGQ